MLKMSTGVYKKIIDSLTGASPESGGVLGAKKDGVVVEYYFDKTGKSSDKGYAPDVLAINKILSEDWMPRGIYMTGIIHSHNADNTCPSCSDIGYGARILASLDTVNEFYIPIFTLKNDVPQIHCYKIYRAENGIPVCVFCEYKIIDL